MITQGVAQIIAIFEFGSIRNEHELCSSTQTTKNILENCQLDTDYRLFAKELFRQQSTGQLTLATFPVQRFLPTHLA